jgi:hypothetical protein
LLKKDITESFDIGMANARCNDSTHTIYGITLMGNPTSKNGYTYKEQALNDIVRLAGGTQCYLDHQAKSEQRDRDNIRSIKDLLGKISRPRKQNGRIIGDLEVLKPHWEFAKSLATMGITNIGMSLHCKALIANEKGQENVVGVDTVHGFDIVTSPATTTSLWEQYHRDITEIISDGNIISAVVKSIEGDKVILENNEREYFVSKQEFKGVPKIGETYLIISEAAIGKSTDITESSHSFSSYEELERHLNYQNTDQSEVIEMANLSKEAIAGLEAMGRHYEYEESRKLIHEALKMPFTGMRMNDDDDPVIKKFNKQQEKESQWFRDYSEGKKVKPTNIEPTDEDRKAIRTFFKR